MKRSLLVLIPLPDGSVTFIDAEDWSKLRDFGWHRHKRGYVVGHIPGSGRSGRGRSTKARLHRLVMDAPRGVMVDHMDGDALWNTKSNLRLCSNQQNQANQRAQRGRTSRFKGVWLDKRNRRWIAGIMVNKRRMHLGTFSTEEEAARAYDKAAVQAFGEFARPNFG